MRLRSANFRSLHFTDCFRPSDFKTKFRAARRELVEATTAQLQQDGADAAKALREIVNNKKAPASVRVSAAKVILEQGIKAVELVDLAERLDRLEEMERARGGKR